MCVIQRALSLGTSFHITTLLHASQHLPNAHTTPHTQCRPYAACPSGQEPSKTHISLVEAHACSTPLASLSSLSRRAQPCTSNLQHAHKSAGGCLLNYCDRFPTHTPHCSSQRLFHPSIPSQGQHLDLNHVSPQQQPPPQTTYLSRQRR